jgi:hypothetical protein
LKRSGILWRSAKVVPTPFSARHFFLLGGIRPATPPTIRCVADAATCATGKSSTVQPKALRRDTLFRPAASAPRRRRDGDPCAGGDIKRGGFRRLPWEHRVGPRSALLPRVRPPGRVPAGPSIDLDADVPADARLEEFNLLIPVGADRSGIPVSILRFMLTNTMGVPISSSM